MSTSLKKKYPLGFSSARLQHWGDGLQGFELSDEMIGRPPPEVSSKSDQPSGDHGAGVGSQTAIGGGWVFGTRCEERQGGGGKRGDTGGRRRVQKLKKRNQEKGTK